MKGQYGHARLAAAQAAPVFLDREATVDKACEIIEEAGRQGVDLLGFPEGFIPAHPIWYYHYPATSRRALEFAEALFFNAIEIPGPETERLSQAARRAAVNVVIGVCERRPKTTGTLFNTQLYISREGEILGKHQKLVPTVGERLVHSAGNGDGVRTFDTDLGPVGGLICGENSNPLAIYKLMADSIRVHVSSWPHYFFPGWTKMYDTALVTGRSIAYMSKCFVINACGTVSEDMRELMIVTEDDRQYLDDPKSLGGSTIIAPDGTVLAGPVGPDEELVIADVDLKDTVRGKLIHDFSGHYQRFDVFAFGTIGSAPHESAERLLTRGYPERVHIDMVLPTPTKQVESLESGRMRSLEAGEEIHAETPNDDAG